MKTNPNDAAFARPFSEDKFHGGECEDQFGLTKLEWFAGLAFQGIMSKPFMFISSTNETFDSLRIKFAKDAVLAAKALIDELNKEESEDDKR